MIFADDWMIFDDGWMIFGDDWMIFDDGDFHLDPVGNPDVSPVSKTEVPCWAIDSKLDL